MSGRALLRPVPEAVPWRVPGFARAPLPEPAGATRLRAKVPRARFLGRGRRPGPVSSHGETRRYIITLLARARGRRAVLGGAGYK